MRKEGTKQYWQEKEKFMKSLRGKPELTPDEWKAIVYESWAIYANHKTGLLHGGTASSCNLRTAIAQMELLVSGIKQPEVFDCELPRLKDLIEHTQVIIDAAKVGLERHNAQSNKLFEYNVETGEPLAEDSLSLNGSNNMLAEELP